MTFLLASFSAAVSSATYFFASPIGSLSPKRDFRSSNVPRRSTFFSCWLSVLLTIWFLNVVNGLFAPVQYSKYYKLHIHYRELNLRKKRLSTESLSNIYKILFFKKVSNYRTPSWNWTIKETLKAVPADQDKKCFSFRYSIFCIKILLLQ